MKFFSYKATILEWSKLYPIPPSAIEPYDPTQTRACCVRCGSIRKLSRHHKGNDFYFALLRPDLYAARYIQFRSEDVVKLCDKCHKYVHTFYKKMMVQVKMDIDVAFLGGKPSQECCDYWMNEFRMWFDKWIQKPYKKRKKRGKRQRKASKRARRGF